MRYPSRTHLRTRLSVVLTLVAVLVAALGSGGSKALANDIQPYRIERNTNMASAGFGGIRGVGSGTLQLSGVSGTVTQALLYWHGPTNTSNTSANATVTFAGSSVTGSNIGLSSDNCWGFDNSQAYRADVTSLVTGNGSYELSNFRKPDAEINGVSLIVFFDDGNAANNRDIVLFDGNDSNAPNPYDASGWNVTLAGIQYRGGDASIRLHVSDGQRSVSFTDAGVTLNGRTLVGSGQIFSGDSVPNGSSASRTSGGLWDISSFDVTSALTPGDNTLTLRSGFLNDCLSLVTAVIDLPAGSAPDSFIISTRPRKIEPARLYVMQRPNPNTAVSSRSLVTYEVVVENIGPGRSKQATVTMPINPAAAEVLDATFTKSEAWVTSVTSTTLTFNTGPLASGGDVVTGTIRLRLKPDAAAGLTLTERLHVRWRDDTGSSDRRSNLPILTTGASDDHRSAYQLAVSPASGPAGSTHTFSSAIFVPNEGVGLWYYKAGGEDVTVDTVYADDDGGISQEFNTKGLAPGTYVMVARGLWSQFEAVTAFEVQ
jgi:hypothetical protein